MKQEEITRLITAVQELVATAKEKGFHQLVQLKEHEILTAYKRYEEEVHGTYVGKLEILEKEDGEVAAKEIPWKKESAIYFGYADIFLMGFNKAWENANYYRLEAPFEKKGMIYGKALTFFPVCKETDVVEKKDWDDDIIIPSWQEEEDEEM